MKITRALATLSAATLVPVVLLAAPAAHADQTWTGQVTEQDPTAVFIRPVHETEGCGTDGGQQATFNYDSVSFTSTTDGPRRFAVSSAGFSLPSTSKAVASSAWTYATGNPPCRAPAMISARYQS